MSRTFISNKALLAALALAACSRSQEGSMAPQPGMSGMSAADQSAGWQSLVGLENWRGYKTQTIPTGWSSADNAIGKTGEGADLVSRKEYGDFELAFDWKLSPGGNAGIFYRINEQYDHPYWSGPEYQLLDDARHPDGKNPLTVAASAYGLYGTPKGVVHEAGQWNSGRIMVRGNHVIHWLNDQKVVEYDFGSPDWTAKVKSSKFGAWPNYGKASRGMIGIQGDHVGLLSIRNIKIRELK